MSATKTRPGRVTLDARQREALREEAALRTSGWGDIAWAFREGDRTYARGCLNRLRRSIELMDAIGWSEQADAPDEQPVARTHALAAWARSEAREVLSSLPESTDTHDQDLDAYGALCAIGGEA